MCSSAWICALSNQICAFKVLTASTGAWFSTQM